MEIGRRLQALRGDRSQRDLARDAGLDAGTISRIERGTIDPTISTIARIAQALGVPIGAFFEDRPIVVHQPGSGKTVSFLRSIEHLTPIEESPSIQSVAARVDELTRLFRDYLESSIAAQEEAAASNSTPERSSGSS